jgi:hypothetical protein
MTREAIQAYAEEIGVPYLLHFTRAVNVPSILTHGLYPIGRAHEVGALPQVNDQYRWDGHRNSTSVSIAFPNCQMLWKYRQENAEVDWAILVMPPSVLWTKQCAYCRHNAADARISSQPIDQLMTPSAFAGMFEEIVGLPTRAEQKLKPFDPTDVQAEVLVFDVVEPQQIVGVVFETTAAREMYLPHLGKLKTYVHASNKGLFASRGYARKYQ